MSKIRSLKLDEVGPWSEIKLEIIRKYASAYSTVLSGKPYLRRVYIDGFCGAGVHFSKDHTRIIAGSPKIALDVIPPFHEYYFIDMDPAKLEHLSRNVSHGSNVKLYEGDCNVVLQQEVFPLMQYASYRRALCLLDPYGLHLDWKVVEAAGRTAVIEMFLNFPVADMNRNVFWRNPNGVSHDDLERMNRFWGDESWRQIAYRIDQDLFGPVAVKEETSVIADAYRKRLQEQGGFVYVPEPLAMRNSKRAVVYYLFFASSNKIGGKIVTEIFDKYRVP